MDYAAFGLIYTASIVGCVVLVLHGHPWFGVLVLLMWAVKLKPLTTLMIETSLRGVGDAPRGAPVKEAKEECLGYLHIDNLYKAQEILAFRTCFALEKIHGTSAHVTWTQGRVGFFSGGESHERFCGIFDASALAAQFAARFTAEDRVTVYGEAYGGKCQQMSQTYGKALRFVAFDVQAGEAWLSVPQAAECVAHLGLEFVDFAEVSTDLAALDAERDKPSTQARRNGIEETKIREGVVLRPPFEVTLNNGRRVMAKHKREEFAERGRPKVELDPSKREMLAGAEAIALEWVTPMRLEHVIDTVLSGRWDKHIDMRDTPLVIAAMVADVTREADGEILDSAPARKAISQRTVTLFKQRVQRIEEPLSVDAVDPACASSVEPSTRV